MSKLETMLLKFGRFILIFAAVILLVGGGLYYAWLGYQWVTASPAALEQPVIEGIFTKPKASPIESAEYKIRLADAKKSFSSRADDSCTQIDQNSRRVRQGKNDIDVRYAELINQADLKDVTRILADKDAELSESCKSSRAFNKSELTKLQGELDSVAMNFNVKGSDVASGWEATLKKCVKYQNHCEEYKEIILTVVRNLQGGLPADYGFGYTGGDYEVERGMKQDVPTAVALDYDWLLGVFGDDKVYLDNYFVVLGSYTESLKSYYQEESSKLSRQNKLTPANAQILSEALVESYISFNRSAAQQYEEYLSEKDSIEGGEAMKRAGVVAGAMTGLVPMASIFLILIVLAFFAMERHQRAIGSKKLGGASPIPAGGSDVSVTESE